jgi:hypothetical protein
MSARPGPRGGYRVSGIPTAIVLTPWTCSRIAPFSRAGGPRLKSKSGSWLGEGAFCRPYTPPHRRFDGLGDRGFQKCTPHHSPRRGLVLAPPPARAWGRASCASEDQKGVDARRWLRSEEKRRPRGIRGSEHAAKFRLQKTIA